jgi:formate-dependent nitrite reductase membrane component NrfD
VSATLLRDPARVRYGRPIIKEPVWKPEIPFYFYFGGLAGASAGLAALSELQGNHELARHAWTAAMVGGTASPALLVADLGVPTRFLNMLRMFKVTSPMSVGAWLLTAFGPLTAAATFSAWTGAAPRAGAVGKAGSALLGLPLSTYTAALVANTAVPVWHEARATLPMVFASGAAASAGAAAMALTPPSDAAPARRLTVIGAATEFVSVTVMERRLGELARPYHEGKAGLMGKLAKVCTLGGGILAAMPLARSRPGALGGSALVTAGAVLERWSIFKAGSQSAADPAAVAAPQRQRIEQSAASGPR